MRAFCPKCREMVIVWTNLKMDEAERLLEENQRVVVVHPCVQWLAKTFIGQWTELKVCVRSKRLKTLFSYPQSHPKPLSNRSGVLQ
jgi:hypothetical protein